MTPPVLGAVLVGGASRRMGRDKALIEIDGVPLVEHVAGVLARCGCNDVVAVGPPRLAASVTQLADLHPGQGPLGAILGVLAAAGARGTCAALIVACDLVALHEDALAPLLAAFVDDDGSTDAFLARSTRLEPLCGVWRTRCAIELGAAFESGERAVHRALSGLRVAEVALTPGALTNVNTEQELRRATLARHGDS